MGALSKSRCGEKQQPKGQAGFACGKMFSQQAQEGAVIWKHHMEFHMWHFSTACREEAEPECTISSAFGPDPWVWDFSFPPKCLLQVIKYKDTSRLCL